MKLLAPIALSALFLCGSLRADAIWSYTFTEQYSEGSPQLGFTISHNGPIVAMSGTYFELGSELHSCSAGALFCIAGGFEVLPGGLEAMLNRQLSPNPTVPIPPDSIFFPGASLDQLGTFTVNQSSGVFSLTISDPPDVVPEPSTWALLTFVLIVLGAVSRRSQLKFRLFHRTKYLSVVRGVGT